MPVGVGTMIAVGAIGAGASAAAGIYGAHKASSSANFAATLQAQAEEKQRAYLEAKDKQDQANFEHTQQLNLDQYNRRESQLAPYRAQGEQANRTLANWLNLDGQGGASYLPARTDYQHPTPASAGSAPPPASPEAAFIATYQQSHPVSEGVQPLLAAMKAKGFNVAPYMYGQTPSDNEISLNGAKYKVLGGEGSPAAYWYVPGTNDSGGGGATVPAPTGYKPFTGYGSPAPTLASLAAQRTLTPPTMTLNELTQMMGMNYGN